MAVTLNVLRDNPGARKKRMIVGRGIGSGKGKTCGRGGKGQTARSGVAIKGFEGGQMPIYRRLPKRGFNNHSRVDWRAVNVSLLQTFIDSKKLDASKKIDNQALLEAGVINNLNKPVKLLAKGEIKAKIDIETDGASKSAIALIEKAGGKVTIKAPKQKSEESKKDTTKAAKGKSSEKKSEAA